MNKKDDMTRYAVFKPCTRKPSGTQLSHEIKQEEISEKKLRRTGEISKCVVINRKAYSGINKLGVDCVLLSVLAP